MEAPLNSNYHARSNSLPSASHPLMVDVEDQLQRLSSSEATTSSSALVVCFLANLKDLYEPLEGMLPLPLTQQSFSSERQMEDVLDGSLRLLDICSTSRDVFSQIKGCVLDIESSIRRKNGTESSIANEIKKYFILTKQLNRILKKFSGNTKRTQKNDLGDMAGMLREVEAINLTIFESMYSLICPRNSKINGWSLVSKMIQPKRVYFVDRIDDVLNDLIIKNKSSKGMDVIPVQKALKGLETLESTVQEIVEGLESVFRCLIKTGVSLLNILNN